jgi:type IV secretory pathway VirB2 component (pilin)
MMNGMMEGGGVMMWGMGLLWLLVIVVLVLAAAALVKYLFSGRGKAQRHD